ncbi:phosphatidylinositol transfer protein alpha isoform-like [Boleophthalmus pectinirostris]|uniref:phosphatidylinositol transfer protein alpha isoform-like n=1 Tax=Boleophthalmus pectinirostris TaxID=150288 RepID=UPI000A1C40B3|nr:phosphatidylinositol transfer protein alpha isoform-like [Boleophthalmus pectinirostris]
MLIHEYRIILPISVEEYQIGQLYAVAEASKGETGGGEGVEVLVNEPYKNGDEEGQYTHKIYHLQSKVPGWIRALAPKGSLEIHEKAWNAYPYCKTVLSSEYVGDRFSIEIITWHKPDMGTIENVHGLTEAQLKDRKVVDIDIAANLDDPKDYKEDEDPTKFKSVKTGRGPLSAGWQKALESDTNTPHMCAYKLVKAEFRMFPIQGKVESTIQKMEKRLFTTFHRKLFCTLDDWHGMTMADIREMEEKTKAELDELRKKGAVQGTKADK